MIVKKTTMITANTNVSIIAIKMLIATLDTATKRDMDGLATGCLHEDLHLYMAKVFIPVITFKNIL